MTRLSLILTASVAACASYQGGSSSGGTATLTGTVAYRERMALPPGATITVTLSDVSRMDAAATVIAETTVDPAGRQVPIPFELRYDPGKVLPSGTYSVRATIREGDRLLFSTGMAYPVLTAGRPSRADLMLVPVTAPIDWTVSDLSGTAWRLVDLAGAAVPDDMEATLEFPEAGRVAGMAFCNRFLGSVTVAGSSLSFGQLGATRMACADAVNAQQTMYLTALQAAERFGREGDALLVYLRGDDQPLRFVRVKR